MIRWLREHPTWVVFVMIIASMLTVMIFEARISRSSLPPLADEPERLILPTIEHGTEACRWWLVRWVDTEYREAPCFSEEEVRKVMAWLGRE